MNFVNISDKFDEMSEELKEKSSLSSDEIKEVENSQLFQDFKEQFLSELDEQTEEAQELVKAFFNTNKDVNDKGFTNPYKVEELIKVARSEDGSYNVTGQSKIHNMITFQAKVSQEDIRSFIKYGKPFPMGSFQRFN